MFVSSDFVEQGEYREQKIHAILVDKRVLLCFERNLIATHLK